MASLIQLLRFALPLLHAVFVLTNLVKYEASWALLAATLLLIPFYALGFRVASNWLLVKLGLPTDESEQTR